MKFLAATLILFIGVTGDVALQSASSNASAAQALSAVHVQHVGTSTGLVHPDPFMVGH
jgi:hypothetical protein